MKLPNLKAWMADLPTTVIVVMTGVLLTVATGVRYLVPSGEWKPDESWLLFLIGLMGVNYGVKRLTFKESPPPEKRDIEDVAANGN